VKARYDQYFIGYERREPKRERDEVRKRVMLVKDAFTRNAALKFRIQSLHARYLSYERLWVAERAREGGGHLPPRRLQGAPAREDAGRDAGGRGDARRGGSRGPCAGRSGSAAPAARTPAPPAAPARTPSPQADRLIRALYDPTSRRKKQCGEDVSRISYDAVARTVAKQGPELMAKFKARSVTSRSRSRTAARC